MNDLDFLDRHQRRLEKRIARRSRALSGEAERIVAPLMREHPRTGLVAGAVGGLLLGAAAAPMCHAPFGLMRGAVDYAVRAGLIDSLAERKTEK
jgi:hypothetical protein